MKQGTKCRLKYRPLIEFIFSEIDSIDNKIGWIQYQNDAKHFPVPLSELEPIIEWPKTWEELKLRFQSDPATNQQQKSMIAFAQLSQLHKAIVGDWVPDWSELTNKYVIQRVKNELEVAFYSYDYSHLAFQTREQAEFSLNHHRELWEKYWMF